MTTADGLAQNTVTSILQDSRGFLWFGTEGGLNRYDGYEFKVFKPLPGVTGSLSGTQVWALFEDRSGVLWVGTYDGLNRFNRVTETFDRFRHDPEDPTSLSDDSVRTIFEDGDGNLWIGTKNGLNRLSAGSSGSSVPIQFETFNHDQEDPASLGHPQVRSIYEDRNGRLWVATLGGLDLLNRETKTFEHFLRKQSNPESPGGNGVLVLFESKKGELWVGTYNGGLDRFDTDTWSFEHVVLVGDGSARTDSILAIAEDQSGMVWVGTHGGGLVVLDPTGLSSIRLRGDSADASGLGDDIVWSIAKDRTGIMWIGTSLALAKHDPTRRRFASWQAESGSADLNYVRAIVTDRNGTVWVGSRGGLSTLDWEAGLLAPFTINGVLAFEEHVRALLVDRAGGLWIGSDLGLSRIDRERRRILNATDGLPGSDRFPRLMVSCLLEDHRGDVWVGSRGHGLYRLELEAPRASGERPVRHIERYRGLQGDIGVFSDEHVRCLFEDPDGQLWIGFHRNGLARVDKNRVQVKHFEPKPEEPNGLSSGAVTSILQDQEGAIWLSTYGGGVNRLDPDQRSFSRLTESDGLVDNVVYGMLEDSVGCLWLSTNRGLSRFDPTAVRESRFRNFGARDGLQGDEFNSGAYWQDPQGEMFFGGVNGLNSFRPETIRDDPSAPSVVLTELEVFNQPVNPGDLVNGRRILDCSIAECETLTLRWQENVFAFRFSGLHYSDPEANTYAFRLAGFEREWNRVGTRRIATYSQVPPGRYVFQVRSANPDGRWSDLDTMISVRVEPPFWMTLWFRALSLAAVFVLLFIFYRVRTGRLRRRAETLETLNLRLEKHMDKARRAEGEKGHLLEKVREMHGDLEQAYDATLEGWARALELRDEDTEGHTRRVTELTVKLALRLGMVDDQVEQIRRGAILHDIGKMAVPDNLLRKKGKLTEEDWSVIRKHPEYAQQFLQPIEFLREAAVIPYAHHERWDGSGYPRGLKGFEIPLQARIFAVVDVWDALLSDRPYRLGWSEDRVRKHLEEGAGTMFDPDIVESFLRMMDDRSSPRHAQEGPERKPES